MSELSQNPQEIAAQMAEEAAKHREKQAVYNFVDVADAQSMADFNEYMAARPFEDSAGRLRRPDGKMAKQGYFDQAREAHYDGEQEKPYEDLTWSELADELAHAEITEDKTRIEDISDALLDKMAVTASEANMDSDAQTNFYDRILKLKDKKKLEYIQWADGEASDEARAQQPDESEVAGATSGSGYAETEGKSEVEKAQDAADAALMEIEQAKAHGRPAEEISALAKKARPLVNNALRLKALDNAQKAHEAAGQEAADEFANSAIEELESYIRINDLSEEDADELRANLQSRIEDGESDIFPVKPSDRPGQVGAVRNGETTAEKQNRGQQTKNLRDRLKDLKGRAKDSLKKAKEAVTVDGSTEESADRTERERKLSLSRRMVGATALALTLVGGAVGYAVGNDERELPESVQAEVEQHDELEDAGITDENLRTHIIHNPEDWDRMISTEEGRANFERMMTWRESEIQHRLREIPESDRNANDEDRIAEQVDRQIREYFEDLDDNEPA